MREILLLAALLCPALAAQEAELAAGKLLLRAEEAAAKGRYTAALQLYRQIVERYPSTTAGAVAQRRCEPNAFLGHAPLQVHGPSSNRIDIVVLGDGYTLDKQNMFDDIARTVPKNFGRDPVLEEYLTYQNFWRGNVVSREDGIDGFGREYDTALDGRALDGADSQATVDFGKVRQMLREIPQQDGLAIVFVKAGSLGTGGGGVAVIGGREDDTVIHEWGHAFADLGDEYIDRVHRGRGQNGINVSGTGDPKRVPWKHWIEAGAPGIGVYEGASGMQRGAWKPTTGGCVMEHGRYFCAVCREAVVLEIYRRVDPIDGVKPEAGTELLGESPHTIEVELLRPATHGLELKLWVLPADGAPAERPTPPGAGRDARGPLPPIDASPKWSLPGTGKQASYKLSVREMDPGRYVVILRVRDTTKVPRDTLPWVLKDEAGVLESERRWPLVVGQ